jgi:hypothetical protein
MDIPYEEESIRTPALELCTLRRLWGWDSRGEWEFEEDEE